MNSVSVVIIAYNAKSFIGPCIESVLREVNLKHDEVWVVDNDSPDGTLAHVRDQYPIVRSVASGKNGGFAYACSVGAAKSKGDFILFLNADVRLKVGCVQELIRGIEETDSAAVTVPGLVDQKGDMIQMAWGWDPSLLSEAWMKFLSPKRIERSGVARRLARNYQREKRLVPFVTGACFLTRRSSYERVGGFDPEYELYFEDADLCRRFRDVGYQVLYNPQAQAEHDLGRSGSGESLKIELITRQSQIRYYRLWRSPLQLLLLKAYLRLKFLFHPSPLFKKNFKRVLQEKNKIFLTDVIS